MMYNGVRIGIDVGKARIGVAKSDTSGMLASPYDTVKRDLAGDSHIKEIIAIATEHEAKVIYIGHPVNLSGKVTLSTQDALDVADEISKLHPEVWLIDERLTTVTAQSRLGATGKNVKKSRAIIDQAAAAVLLQQALDIEKSSEKFAGTKVTPKIVITTDSEVN